MPQFRQSGFDRAFINDVGGASTNSVSNWDHVAVGVKLTRHHHRRSRLVGSRITFSTVVSCLCFVLAGSSLVLLYLSSRDPSDVDDVQDDDFKGDFLSNVTRYTTSEVQFGHGSVIHGRDSRYWDGDDRRRDEDYNEDVMHENNTSRVDIIRKGHHAGRRKNPMKVTNDKNKGTNHHGLYNEAGRNELKMYEEKYEASLKNVGQSEAGTEGNNRVSEDANSKMENEKLDIDDEHDEVIDSLDARVDDYENNKNENVADFELPKSHLRDYGNNDVKAHSTHDNLVDDSSQDSSSNSFSKNTTIEKEMPENVADGQSKVNSLKKPKKHGKRHKFSSSQCDMKLLNSTALLVEPQESRKFAKFSLSYTKTEIKPDGVDNWEPRFAGHQSLRDREESFLVRDQKMNCGFVNGPAGHSSTGFDLTEDDVRYISKCRIAVISCIFGNSDRLRSPFTQLVSRLSKKNVCFVMFMDEQTLQALFAEGRIPDRMGFIGLWRVVVVKNLPYSDMRRVGKIPKLLSHRLFPSARYSIWLDSKLRLQRDPLLLLEYLLWRKDYEYAISNHYDRHCVWEEVERNKKLNKFNHTMIDQQFAFYQADGLKRFNASDPNKMLPSNVPEGSLIVRAHTPMSNLFSCLWFNEVDRFTPRDQLSFAYTFQKLHKKNPGKPFYLHMFKDCERRRIAKLFHHRSLQKQIVPEDVTG